MSIFKNLVLEFFKIYNKILSCLYKDRFRDRDKIEF